MGLELKQNLRLSQQLVMTPQLQQAIKLLQLSRLELVEVVRSEMEQNPLLEEPSDDPGAELAETAAEHGPAMLDAMELTEAAPERASEVQPDTKQVADGDVQRQEIDWEQYLDNYQTQHTAPSGGTGNSSEDLPSYEATLTKSEGLAEHLLEQLRMARLSDDEERIGALIIGNLNRDGYLVIDPDEEPGIPGVETAAVAVLSTEDQGDDQADEGDGAEQPYVEVPAVATPAVAPGRTKKVAPIDPDADYQAPSRGTRGPRACCDALVSLALEAGVSASLAERVLRRIQRFDPIGCGSRDLRECLEVQAHWYVTHGAGKDDPDAELLPVIVGRHLKNVETKKYPAIAKDLKVSLEEVVASIKLLSRLDPKPGRLYSTEQAQYIAPDVHIVKVGDTYHTVLNDDGLSKLRISHHYRSALKNGELKGGATKEYVQEKLRSAVWLIRSIHQRQRTIVKVTDSIIKFQRDFLDKGIEHLKPLILRDVAEDIGMHESTVSRVTTNKYVHTPQGIFELKYFFNSSIARVGGEDIASEAVKNQIRQIVAQEPADKPHSDQKIVEILRSQNVDIARRTVAKYREVLGILPSSKRKRYF